MNPSHGKPDRLLANPIERILSKIREKNPALLSERISFSLSLSEALTSGGQLQLHAAVQQVAKAHDIDLSIELELLEKLSSFRHTHLAGTLENVFSVVAAVLVSQLVAGR
jgi:hypothetical protein